MIECVGCFREDFHQDILVPERAIGLAGYTMIRQAVGLAQKLPRAYHSDRINKILFPEYVFHITDRVRRCVQYFFDLGNGLASDGRNDSGKN